MKTVSVLGILLSTVSFIFEAHSTQAAPYTEEQRIELKKRADSYGRIQEFVGWANSAHQVVAAGFKQADAGKFPLLASSYVVLLQLCVIARNLTEEDLNAFPQVKDVTQFLQSLGETSLDQKTLTGPRPSIRELGEFVDVIPKDAVISSATQFLKLYQPIDILSVPRPSLHH